MMKKSKKRILWEYVEALVTALLLALLIRAFVIQAFKIPTGSMETTLLVGDHILVNKFIYGTKLPFSDKRILAVRKPLRGDIVVFKYPSDPGKDFIKRIIAVEGDVIESRNKAIFINGNQVEQPFARYTDKRMRPFDRRDNFGPVLIPKDRYFVMGDNRDQSYDSRYWGLVEMNDIKGKALFIYWSWDGKEHLPRLSRMTKAVR